MEGWTWGAHHSIGYNFDRSDEMKVMIKIKWLLTRGKGLGVTGLIVCVCVCVCALWDCSCRVKIKQKPKNVQ